MVWSTTPGLTSATGETFTADTSKLGGGTCIETLAAGGTTALAKSVTTEGNYALCHFLFWIAKATDPTLTPITSGSYDYGTSIYMNETQWGTNGGAVKGNGMQGTNSGGTLISSTTYGHSLTPVKSSSDTTLKVATYSMEWYQPTWANTYAASALRRYNGGGTEKESVKAYCVSKRLLDGTQHKSGGWTG